jgi:hypothetical protein
MREMGVNPKEKTFEGFSSKVFHLLGYHPQTFKTMPA